MKRVASANIILVLTSIAVGLGASGFMVGYPSVLVGNLEAQVAETGTPANAKLFHGYVERQYVDDAMNWSPFQTAYSFGAATRPDVKQWDETAIPGVEAFETAFETRAERDFARNHIGSETVEEGCAMEGGAINYTVLQRYRGTGGTEGYNLSVRTETPTTVTCATETGETTLMTQPEIFNVSHRTRLFHLYNITQNMTSDPGFRFRVEGAAMNVSKMLQIKTDVTEENCDAPEGDGTNGNDPPYNDGPDCQTDGSAFDSPETELADAIGQAENKYEAQVRERLQRYVQEYARATYETPDNWAPPAWNRDSFDAVTIDVDVVELEYRIENVRGRDGSSDPDVYRDRYVSACTQSHGPSTYYHVTADRDRDFDDPGCDCGCPDIDSCCSNPSCREDEQCTDADWAAGSPDTDISCTSASGLNCDRAEPTFPTPTCTSQNDVCSMDDCPSLPSYFPLNENPPHSVNDGQDEDYGMDCPGEKTADDPSRKSSCELDDACNVDTGRFDSDGGPDPHSGEDAISWGEEHGEFVQCTNQDELFSGTHNPWYIQIGEMHADGVEGPGEPGSWSDSTFTDRVFPVAATTTGPAVRGVAEPATAPVREVRRGFFLGPIFDGGGGGGGGGEEGDEPEGPYCGDDSCNGDETKCSCSGDCGAATCSSSCDCDYTATCTCDLDVIETARTDTAEEDEVVQTTALYRFDLKAYVRLRITITDDRYRIPTADGLQPLQFSVVYDQYAIATAGEDGTDSVSSCQLGTTPVNPDTRHTVP